MTDPTFSSFDIVLAQDDDTLSCHSEHGDDSTRLAGEASPSNNSRSLQMTSIVFGLDPFTDLETGSAREQPSCSSIDMSDTHLVMRDLPVPRHAISLRESPRSRPRDSNESSHGTFRTPEFRTSTEETVLEPPRGARRRLSVTTGDNSAISNTLPSLEDVAVPDWSLDQESLAELMLDDLTVDPFLGTSPLRAESPATTTPHARKAWLQEEAILRQSLPVLRDYLSLTDAHLSDSQKLLATARNTANELRKYRPTNPTFNAWHHKGRFFLDLCLGYLLYRARDLLKDGRKTDALRERMKKLMAQAEESNPSVSRVRAARAKTEIPLGWFGKMGSVGL